MVVYTVCLCNNYIEQKFYEASVNWYTKFYKVNMTLCHAASVAANYLSAVESDNSDDGNDEYSKFESEGVSE